MSSSDTPARPSGAYHHGDLENTLVALALTQIARTGSVEFTLRGLARDAGVSHVAAYRHFADKRALLARIAELGFLELTEAISADPRPGDPVEVFVQQGLGYVRFALEHPGHFRVMWHHSLADRSEFQPLWVASRGAFGCLRATVATLHAKGLTRPGFAIDELSTFAWAGVHGVATLLLDGVLTDPGEAQDRLRAQVVALIRVAVLS